MLVVAVAALPEMLIFQVPVASAPERDGTSRFVLALGASVAPVPPFVSAKVPANVIVPLVVIGPPLVVRPVVPPETSTEVTVPSGLVDH